MNIKDVKEEHIKSRSDRSLIVFPEGQRPVAKKSREKVLNIIKVGEKKSLNSDDSEILNAEIKL